MTSAKLILNNQEYEFPVFAGTEGEVAIDFTKLRAQTGAIAYDPGYGNTGSCTSTITFIDGEQGILRYRGYPIEQLAEKSSFMEVCYLLFYDKLPTAQELNAFQDRLKEHTRLHEEIKKILEGFPASAHPMAIASSVVVALSAFYPDSDDEHEVDLNMTRLLAEFKTLAAFAYRKTSGQPYANPRSDLSYPADFLNMMFSSPARPAPATDVLTRALDLLLILHADHEQNCSTSTVRTVGSARANLFASISAGINALWGPLHGGANQEVIDMLEMIKADGSDYRKYMDMAKDRNSHFRLMGFGHRVYKNFDPRAKILKNVADDVLNELGIHDPLLDIAVNLESIALNDSYFVERKLYPNVDFYSGIIYRAMGIPTNMLTVMFSLGRLPGWIAQWKEMREDPATRITRPRQIYTGATARDFVPLNQR